MNQDEYANIFNKDAVQDILLPLLSTIAGRHAIAEYITNVTKGATGWGFTHFNFFPTSKQDTVFVEFEGSAMVTATGKLYKQIYIGRITLRGKQIANYREYWNPASILEAFV